VAARHLRYVFAVGRSDCYDSAMKRLLALCLTALVLAGCKSHSLSPWVSPRVTGRVLAADTGQPLADVKVINAGKSENVNHTVPPKGGQVLMSKPAARTDRDGKFVLEAERVLTPFSGSGWFSMELFFERAGYERFHTNYSYLNLKTNSWKGEPALDAGEILLQLTPR
jgi:hypothetical protein